MSIHDDECIHGLPPEACSLCQHPYKPPEPETVDFYLRARYDGVCPECEHFISAGDEIAKLKPSERYVHRWCAP